MSYTLLLGEIHVYLNKNIMRTETQIWPVYQKMYIIDREGDWWEDLSTDVEGTIQNFFIRIVFLKNKYQCSNLTIIAEEVYKTVSNVNNHIFIWIKWFYAFH